MEVKYKKLIKNTAIFTIGSFGSKLLSFFIVPLYTYVLSTSEYGRIDLFTTAISLMLPFTTLLMQEAVIRFVSSKEIEEAESISNSFLVFCYGVIVVLAFRPLYYHGFQFGEYTDIYVFALILNTYNSIFSQHLRAVGKTVAFSINGIINTAVFLSGNLIFLFVLDMGMIGYFYSMLISQFVCAVHVTICGRLFHNFSIKKFDINILKEMLRYSVPLIPNSLMWWIMNAGDKYIINCFLGDSANGIYSVSMKIPTIISMAYNIFMQAWQLSAIEENDKEGNSDFYNSVFAMLSVMMGLLSAGIIMGVYPAFSILLNESYLSAWKYVPYLCIATIISCFATFAGTTYIVAKKSTKAFTTTLLGAVINLLLNFLLIKNLGLYGVAAGTACGYFAVLMVRFRDMQIDLKISLDYRRFILLLALLLAESICVVAFPVAWKIIIGCVTIFAVCMLYRKESISVFRIIRKKIISLKF